MRERAVAFAVLVFGLMAAPAYELDPHAFGGHLGLGYSHLVIADSPGGSLSVAAGVDYPIAPSLRLGGDIGFELLGSRTILTPGVLCPETAVPGELFFEMLERRQMRVHWT